ncbi:MerR family transcriptional regulator [Parahaliea mediterranea]|uniref:MerR family transcriptional regulator n=1 Tax=Parahaliea mediterranea TaxID=651086 RepID=UPI000C0AACD9|nr:MerR family transcriptional regulator [Parahaliea mediterranea]MAC33759.1 MerR family transcriptional regulator [Haliea sp.]|tara:strand:+ start:2482 stop:2901 length:420 start_codon:yes stop_codon:yes gene_type:complete
MHVNQLARDIGVTGDTVRYYTRIGFLNPVKNPVNGYKEYSPKDRRLLRFILSARQLGFSVNDIGQILHTADQGISPCPLARRLIQQRLEENGKSFRDSAQLRQRMLSAVATWNQKPDRAPTGDMVCHLIEEFSDGEHTS